MSTQNTRKKAIEPISIVFLYAIGLISIFFITAYFRDLSSLPGLCFPSGCANQSLITTLHFWSLLAGLSISAGFALALMALAKSFQLKPKR